MVALREIQYLSGWKAIADHLGMGVRTVQRYERELSLPVHRPASKLRGAVVASKVEIEGWMAALPGRTNLASTGRALSSKMNRTIAEFLRVDSEIALTFSGLALASNDPESKRRRAQTARKAYETIIHLKENIDLSDEQSDSLNATLQRLKSELQSIGQL